MCEYDLERKKRNLTIHRTPYTHIQMEINCKNKILTHFLKHCFKKNSQMYVSKPFKTVHLDTNSDIDCTSIHLKIKV